MWCVHACVCGVCVCVCGMCAHACICTCVGGWVCLCVHVHVYVRACICVGGCMYVCVWVCVCMCVHAYVCVCLRACVGCVCVCVCVRAGAGAGMVVGARTCTCVENLWQHALSHHLLIATVLVGKTNCNYPQVLDSPDLALCNHLAFHETQHWVYRPLFCIRLRNATEPNCRSHNYNKRGLPEGLSAMAGLLEHLCT